MLGEDRFDHPFPYGWDFSFTPGFFPYCSAPNGENNPLFFLIAGCHDFNLLISPGSVVDPGAFVAGMS